MDLERTKEFSNQPLQLWGGYTPDTILSNHRIRADGGYE